MKQKLNEKGILNIRVSRAVLRGVKAKAELEGRTLQWVVEHTLAESLTDRPSAAPTPVSQPDATRQRRCRDCNGMGQTTIGESQELVSCPACDATGWR